MVQLWEFAGWLGKDYLLVVCSDACWGRNGVFLVRVWHFKVCVDLSIGRFGCGVEGLPFFGVALHYLILVWWKWSQVSWSSWWCRTVRRKGVNSAQVGFGAFYRRVLIPTWYYSPWGVRKVEVSWT